MIEGHDKTHDKKRLMTLASLVKEKDPLHRIMELSQKYFESISDKLWVGDVLLRRKIESEGYVIILYYINDRSNLENMPFKPSEQKSTLAGNARMFARLLCSVLRMIQQKHKWCEDYPFDEKQEMAVDNVYTALEDESEEVDVVVIAVIHKLTLALFCKE